MPRIPLYLYHEQWVGFTNDDAQIVPWHIKVPDEIGTAKVRIFIKEIEVDIPEVQPLEEIEIKNAMVAGFHAKKKEIQAEAQLKLNELDDKIQQLLAITFKE
jgi:hypothetical protein